MLAAEFRLTVTVVRPAAASVPLVEDTLSQAEVLATCQFNEAAPKLVRVKACEVTVNGPPTVPEESKPNNGVMFRTSDGARALMRLVPVGVPNPVHKSYPFVA